MTLDESMHPVVCAACNQEAPGGADADAAGGATATPEQLHGLGWITAQRGQGWLCGECAATADK